MTLLRSSVGPPGRGVLICAVLVGLAVRPQLSARLTGETYELAVAPLDPIDPFRGAYVTLDYPGLEQAQPTSWSVGRYRLRGARRTARGCGPVARHCRAPRERAVPALRRRSGPAAVRHREPVRPQDEARRLEQDVADGAVAMVRRSTAAATRPWWGSPAAESGGVRALPAQLAEDPAPQAVGVLDRQVGEAQSEVERASGTG